MKILLILFFCFSNLSAFSQRGYQVVVQTDFDGQVVSGSIDSLIAAIREGKPVRVGWQLDFNKDKQPDFDHWVDAEFITILNGHVFTQIETIYMQGPNLEIPQVEIYASSNQWTGVIGTNGKLLNRFIMDKTPKISPEAEAKMDDALKEQITNITKVKTWEVATFWSVMQ